LGLTLRATKYTESELGVKDELERLFWIEIAKRKARQMCNEAFDNMLALNQELLGWFEQNQTSLRDPLEDGADLFWDAVQFGSYHVPFARPDGQLDLADKAISLFSDRGLEVARRLPCHRGFHLSDFSVVTDLMDLYNWWTYINSGTGRKELHAKGLFSCSGERHHVVATEELRFAGHDHATVSVGEEISRIITASNPVRIPRRVMLAKFRSLTTDEHDIVLNGKKLSDRLLLDFDLSKPLPTMREVELALRAAFSSARWERTVAILESRIITDPSSLPGDDWRVGDTRRLYLTQPEEHQIMTAQTSVPPLIFGLHGWDLMSSGLNQTQAANQALKDLLPASGLQKYTDRQAKYGMKMVRAKIDRYDPVALPWND
jgi:hypothetical protein